LQKGRTTPRCIKETDALCKELLQCVAVCSCNRAARHLEASKKGMHFARKCCSVLQYVLAEGLHDTCRHPYTMRIGVRESIYHLKPKTSKHTGTPSNLTTPTHWHWRQNTDRVRGIAANIPNLYWGHVAPPRHIPCSHVCSRACSCARVLCCICVTGAGHNSRNKNWLEIAIAQI